MKLPDAEQYSDLLRLLDGQAALDHLTPLVAALNRQGRARIHGTETRFAVGLDANVLLGLGKGKAGTDVIDYLSARHPGPVILPSQSILEFWNNYLSSVETLGGKLRKAFDDLQRVLESLDPTQADIKQRALPIVAALEDRYGYILEGRTASTLVGLFSGLTEAAIVPQLPRSPLMRIAQQRQAVKAPPGFRDGGSGDFFVWAEFLLGLRIAGDRGEGCAHAVLVTDDTKRDWSTDGTTHPYLRAEVSAWTGATFETWTIDMLRAHVAELL